MTNKDLNLALDQNFIHGNAQNKEHQDEAARQSESDVATEATNNPNSAEPSRYTTDKPGPNKPANPLHRWIPNKITSNPWASGILVAVSLVLLITSVVWLTTPQAPSNTTKTRIAIPLPPPAPEQPISTQRLEALSSRLDAMDEKLDQLELKLGEQQSLIASSAHDLSAQVQSLQQTLQTMELSTSASNNTKESAPTPAETKNWYVNLGTFSTESAAKRLQRQVKNLGHKVQINVTKVDDKKAYRVQLPGFKDRDAAEVAAQKIMKKTNLNGLWTWYDG